MPWGVEQSRILITTDKDFGDRVFIDRLVHRGIILLRPADDLLTTKIRILSHLLTEQAHELADSFVVAGSDRVRIRTTKR